MTSFLLGHQRGLAMLLKGVELCCDNNTISLFEWSERKG